MTLHDHRTIPALKACKVCNPPAPEPVGPPPPGTWFSGIAPDRLAAAIAQVQTKDPEAIERTHNKDPYFALFMLLVDRRCRKVSGLGYGDLADFAFHDAYDNGASPREVVQELLEDNDFPFQDGEGE